MVLGFCSAAGRQMTVQRRADDCIEEGRRLCSWRKSLYRRNCAADELCELSVRFRCASSAAASSDGNAAVICQNFCWVGPADCRPDSEPASSGRAVLQGVLGRVGVAGSVAGAGVLAGSVVVGVAGVGVGGVAVAGVAGAGVSVVGAGVTTDRLLGSSDRASTVRPTRSLAVRVTVLPSFWRIALPIAALPAAALLETGDVAATLPVVLVAALPALLAEVATGAAASVAAVLPAGASPAVLLVGAAAPVAVEAVSVATVPPSVPPSMTV